MSVRQRVEETIEAIRPALQAEAVQPGPVGLTRPLALVQAKEVPAAATPERQQELPMAGQRLLPRKGTRSSAARAAASRP